MAQDEAPNQDWLLRGTADPREVAHRYDEWAGTYEADLAAWDYRAPAVVAELARAHHPDAGSVLDVGCGTGLVGKELRARGFAGRIIGLDISPSSLRVAGEGAAYDRLEQADLQRPLDLEDDVVEVLVCAGVMTYLPEVEAVWREFARVVRSTGLVVVTQREDLWEPRRCPEIIDRLTSEGVWTPLEVGSPAPYLPRADGQMAGLGCHYVTARIT